MKTLVCHTHCTFRGCYYSHRFAVHRLTASLAFLLHLSPSYAEHLQPLIEVLQVREILMAKLSGGPGGCGEKGVVKKDVRDLVKEVADELCSSSSQSLESVS